jgi:hypothetical protein
MVYSVAGWVKFSRVLISEKESIGEEAPERLIPSAKEGLSTGFYPR